MKTGNMKTRKNNEIGRNHTKSHENTKISPKLASIMSISPVAAHSPRVVLEGSIQKAAHRPSPVGNLILDSIRPVRKLMGDFDLILDDVYHLSSTSSASRSAWFMIHCSMSFVSVLDLMCDCSIVRLCSIRLFDCWVRTDFTEDRCGIPPMLSCHRQLSMWGLKKREMGSGVGV